MPKAGTKLRYGNRDYIFGEPMFNSLQQDKHLSISYKASKQIIKKSDDIIADIIMQENDGFKLPFGLGYICVCRFKSKKMMIDWKTTHKTGVRSYFANLATLGDSIRITWFRTGYAVQRSKVVDIFKFKSCRKLSRSVSDAFKNGKQYSEWAHSDFLQKSKLETSLDKKFNKQLNEDN